MMTLKVSCHFFSFFSFFFPVMLIPPSTHMYHLMSTMNYIRKETKGGVRKGTRTDHYNLNSSPWLLTTFSLSILFPLGLL